MKINLKEHLSLTEKRNAKSDLLFSRKRNRRRCAAFRNTQKGLAFILPSFAGVCIFWLIPYVDVIRRSFCGAEKIYADSEKFLSSANGNPCSISGTSVETAF